MFIQFLWLMGLLSLGANLGGGKNQDVSLYSPQRWRAARLGCNFSLFGGQLEIRENVGRCTHAV